MNYEASSFAQSCVCVSKTSYFVTVLLLYSNVLSRGYSTDTHFSLTIFELRAVLSHMFCHIFGNTKKRVKEGTC